MGRVLQTQRRAIESLRSAAMELNSHKELDSVDMNKVVLCSLNEVYVLEPGRTMIYPWGTSVGVGTCSDIRGMNVLVMGLNELKEMFPVFEPHEYVVLCRSVTDEERREYKEVNRYGGDPSLACVELIWFVRRFPFHTITFARTGKKQVYVSLV